ncbi:MAG: cytochrome b N-terminal domain-containing protein [Desulfobacterales bacterium]|jgi:ubiquinol-cytochrome c reductase cytochrome b subunit|nr:cytochrome b N-terminal domain-containing protein [Desulfobacterales bacterium]
MKQEKKFLQWLDDRTGLVKLIKSIADHPAAPGVKWKYVFGSAVLTAFLMQVVTGIGLLTTYVPSSGGAYESLQYITDKAPLGAFLRGMHYWGASMMVVLLIIHFLRVFLMGSFKFPRELNWITGVLLMATTLVTAFCGQIVRWDQDAVFGLVVASKMAAHVPLIGTWLAHFIIGGGVVGSYTLSRIFDMHVIVLPTLLASLIGLHVYLVLRNGVSEPPVPGRGVDPATYRSDYHDMLRKEGVPFWPTVVLRDFVFATGVVLVVLLLAWLVGARELGHPPDPSLINAHPRPDWYFWWLFAVLALLPHALENFFMIALPLLIGLVLLSVPLVSNRGERHPARRPLAVAVVVFIFSGIVALTVAGWHENWSPRVNASPLTADIIGASSGPVYEGAMVFNNMGCLFCHTIEGHGGKRGPNLTWIADRLTRDQLTLRIMNGAYNMPVFGRILSTAETENLLDFLSTRKKFGFETGKQQSVVRPSGPLTHAALHASEELAIINSAHP